MDLAGISNLEIELPDCKAIGKTWSPVLPKITTIGCLEVQGMYIGC